MQIAAARQQARRDAHNLIDQAIAAMRAALVSAQEHCPGVSPGAWGLAAHIGTVLAHFTEHIGLEQRLIEEAMQSLQPQTLTQGAAAALLLLQQARESCAQPTCTGRLVDATCTGRLVHESRMIDFF